MKNNKILNEAIIDYKELKGLLEEYVRVNNSSNIVNQLSKLTNEDVNTTQDDNQNVNIKDNDNLNETDKSNTEDVTTQKRKVEVEMEEIEESTNKDVNTQKEETDKLFSIEDIVDLIKQEVDKEKEVEMKSESALTVEGFKEIFKESLKELLDSKKDELDEDDVTLFDDEIDEAHGVSLSNNKRVNGNLQPREAYAQYKKNKLRSALQESKRRLNESTNNNGWVGIDDSLEVSLNEYQYIFKNEGNGEWSVISTVPYKYTYGGFEESDLDDYMNDVNNEDKRNKILSAYDCTFEEWQRFPIPRKAFDVVGVSDYSQLGISGYDKPMTAQEVADETDIDIDTLEDSIDESHGISYSNNKRAGADTQPRVAYAQYKKNKLRSALQEELKTSYDNRIKLLSESYKKAKQETLAIKDINNEYKDVLTKYRDQLNEMVVFNTRISHMNEILINENLNEKDKAKMLKEFENAKSVEEIEKTSKLISESFKKDNKEVIKEEALIDKFSNVVESNTSEKLIGEAVERGTYRNNSHINKIKQMFNYIENK